MKNKLKKMGAVALLTVAATVASASAAITTTEAEAAITQGKDFAEDIGIASFAIAGVWLVVRIVRKGIKGAA